MGMNNVSLVGRLTKDIDLKYLNDGKAVGNGNLAVNRPFKNKEGEQEADFILFNVWGKQAENLAQYMKKGDRIGMTGRIQTRNYENNESQRVYVTEVVAENVQFLQDKKERQGQSVEKLGKSQTEPETEDNKNMPYKTDGEPIDISDDELPF